MEKKATPALLILGRGCHEGGREEESGHSSPSAPHLHPLLLLCFSPFPELSLQRLTPCASLTHGRYPSSHLRGGIKVEYRLATPSVRQKAPNLPVCPALDQMPDHIRPRERGTSVAQQ